MMKTIFSIMLPCQLFGHNIQITFMEMSNDLIEHIYRLTKMYYPFHIGIYPWLDILQLNQLERV